MRSAELSFQSWNMYSFDSWCAAAKRWLQFLEPPELIVQGAVDRRDDGDVVPLEVRQIQSRRSDHREVYARREVLASGQHRRHER